MMRLIHYFRPLASKLGLGGIKFPLTHPSEIKIEYKADRLLIQFKDWG